MSKFTGLHIVSPKLIIASLLVVSLFAIAAPGIARAEAPVKDTYFICPAVGNQNPNGMWVIGTHGAYYVLVPSQGGVN